MKLRVESGGLFEDLPPYGRRHRDHRRPSERRERHHRRPPVSVPPLPQQRRRPAARGRRDSPRVYTQARRRPPESPGLFSLGRSQVRDPRRGASSTARARARPTSRSSSRAPRTASATRWSGRPIARTSPATRASRSSGSSSTVRLPGPTRRPPWRLPRTAALHRLADLLRLRRRAGEAQQADRHEDLDSALPPSDQRKSGVESRCQSLVVLHLPRLNTKKLPADEATGCAAEVVRVPPGERTVRSSALVACEVEGLTMQKRYAGLELDDMARAVEAASAAQVHVTLRPAQRKSMQDHPLVVPRGCKRRGSQSRRRRTWQATTLLEDEERRLDGHSVSEGRR